MTAPRRSLSKSEQLAMFIRQEGRCNCGRCDGAKLMPGEIHEQHEPPFELMKDVPGYDGKPSKLFRKACHLIITKEEDGPRIVKSRHQAGGKGSQIYRRNKRGGSSIKSRGFDKTKTRGFDGRVRERAAPTYGDRE